MTSQERALRILSMARLWTPGDPEKVSEASPIEKVQKVAKWGLEGNDEKLDEAESALGVSTKGGDQ